MKKILIVVDMQNDFISGSLGTKEAVSIVPCVRERLEQARLSGETIIFTRDTHNEDYMNTQEGKKLPVPHCINGTHGHEIEESLKPYAADAIVIDKPTFGSYSLVDMLRSMVDQDTVIELLGLCTDICVASNALLIKNAFPEIRVQVNADCCAGVTVESHEAAITTMSSCQVEILNRA